jgi:hypothetical protein
MQITPRTMRMGAAKSRTALVPRFGASGIINEVERVHKRAKRGTLVSCGQCYQRPRKYNCTSSRALSGRSKEDPAKLFIGLQCGPNGVIRHRPLLSWTILPIISSCSAQLIHQSCLSTLSGTSSIVAIIVVPIPAHIICRISQKFGSAEGSGLRYQLAFRRLHVRAGLATKLRV